MNIITKQTIQMAHSKTKSIVMTFKEVKFNEEGGSYEKQKY